MYHRIGTPGSPPGKLTVSPQRFADHLEAIQSRFETVPLATIVEGMRAGALPRRSVALTFDDGYVDNLLVAKPLLERFGVPATVFVVSGYVGTSKPFWWDELERICTQPQALPATLRLVIAARERTWRTTGERRTLYRELREAFAPLPETEREELVAELRAWSGARRGRSEAMSAEQLRSLVDGNLIEVGAHTVSHPSLPALDRASQIAEIRGSRDRLAELLGREVRLFSYPFGAHDRTTVESARAAGTACACTTVGDGVQSSGDPYRLPRLYVGDWAADELVAAVAARLG